MRFPRETGRAKKGRQSDHSKRDLAVVGRTLPGNRSADDGWETELSPSSPPSARGAISDNPIPIKNHARSSTEILSSEKRQTKPGLFLGRFRLCCRRSFFRCRWRLRCGSCLYGLLGRTCLRCCGRWGSRGGSSTAGRRRGGSCFADGVIDLFNLLWSQLCGDLFDRRDDEFIGRCDF